MTNDVASLIKEYDEEVVAEVEDATAASRVRRLLRDGVKSLSRPLKSYEVSTLRPIHKQIIALSAAGMKNVEIGELLDVSGAWVSQILKQPDAQVLRNEMVAEYVTGLHGDARELIAAHTKEAILTVVKHMRTGKENTSLAAAKDILDRGGFKPQERIVSTNINLSANDAAALRDAMREMLEPVPEMLETEVTSAVFAEKREVGGE